MQIKTNLNLSQDLTPDPDHDPKVTGTKKFLLIIIAHAAKIVEKTIKEEEHVYV